METWWVPCNLFYCATFYLESIKTYKEQLSNKLDFIVAKCINTSHSELKCFIYTSHCASIEFITRNCSLGHCKGERNGNACPLAKKRLILSLQDTIKKIFTSLSLVEPINKKDTINRLYIWITILRHIIYICLDSITWSYST